ncbi:TPA: hypothetical protein NHT93_002059 [Klebsiella oxytoca]|nr:hypothetical protein [Klebsiella oxytoca]
MKEINRLKILHDVIDRGPGVSIPAAGILRHVIAYSLPDGICSGVVLLPAQEPEPLRIFSANV